MMFKSVSLSALVSLIMVFGVAAQQVDKAYEREILRALGELPDDEKLAPEYANDPKAEISPDKTPLPRRDPRNGAGKPVPASATIGDEEDDLDDASSLADAIAAASIERAAVRRNAPWVYTEGIARAIRREYLTFQNAGRIAYVDPNLREGMRVEAGQMLAYQEQSRTKSEIASADAQVIDAQTQLAVAQATSAEAMAQLRFATKTYERFKVLIEQDSASQQEFDQAKAQLESAHATAVKASRQIASVEAQINVARSQRAQADVTKQDSQLVAPISGIIARFNIDQGYYYSPQLIQTSSEKAVLNTVPVVIIDTSRFEVTLKLRSELFDSLAVGGEAFLEIVDEEATLEDRLPDEMRGPQKAPGQYAIAGTIYSISPSFDTETRTFNVKIRTTRGAERLRDGENVALWLRKGSGNVYAGGQGVVFGQPTPAYVQPQPLYGQPEPLVGQPVPAFPVPDTMSGQADFVFDQPGLVYDIPATVYPEAGTVETGTIYQQPATTYPQPGIVYQ